MLFISVSFHCTQYVYNLFSKMNEVEDVVNNFNNLAINEVAINEGVVSSTDDRDNASNCKTHTCSHEEHLTTSVKEEREAQQKSATTALIYDERMQNYWCKSSPDHVERPARIESIFKKLNVEGLASRCMLLTPRFATKEEILLKHTEKHYKTIKSVKNKTLKQLLKLEENYDSIYFHKEVTEASFLSAGCTLEIVEQVLKGNVTNGAAVVRPPGHHALSHCSMGFCHFNNVALAAMLAVIKYNLHRVLIVDWDVHYGNGIHKMFESDPRVLYFSLHRFDNQFFWPCLAEGNYDAIGTGDGTGFNIHVAWNKKGMQDVDYMCAFTHILMPVATEYDPELILVSSGFDSGHGDPLGCCKVSPTGYAHMTKKLMSLANGKVVIVLEGGYNLNTISNSMAACVKTLLGDEVPPLKSGEASVSAVNSISNTLHAIQPYWKTLSVIDERFSIANRQQEEYVYESSSDDEKSPELMYD